MSLRSWEKRGRRQLTRALGGILGARGEPPDPPDLRDLERILLVRQQNQLGDMLLSTPVFRAVRERAPEARIDLISGPFNHAVVVGNRHLNRVLLYDKATYFRRPIEAKRFADRLRKTRYDLVLVLSTVSFSFTSVWLAALAGARFRAGRAGPRGQGTETAEKMFHWVLPPPVETRHQTGQNLDLVSPFGASGTDWTPEIFLTGSEEEQGRRDLDTVLGPRSELLRIVLHPGAGKHPNRWPAERFGCVAGVLAEHGHRVATCAGPGERGLLHTLDSGAGRAFPRLPAVEIRRLAGALKAADLVIANDTGILHLGASVGTPVLALFGPTDPAIWCPAQPAVRTLRAPDGDLENLPAESVEQAALGFAAHLRGEADLPRELAPAPGRTP